jgi:hypothetical protein
MTRTEERLIDALGAVGRGVREETLPPLPAHGPAARPARWGRWLAPVAAAAGVVLVVATLSAVHLFAGPGRPGRTLAPPHYYVSAKSSGIQVRRTATGAVTAIVPDPFPGPGGPAAFVVGLAAGDGGREFVAEYTGAAPRGGMTETRLYSFHLTSAGRIAGLSLVKGGLLRGLQGGSALAVAPDGSKVALAVFRPVRFGRPDILQIAVVNLRTGARSYWSGGLDRAGFHLSIPSISWSPGGDSVVFLSQWCRAVVVTGFCGPGTPAAQVRTLRVTGDGGRLSSGRVLLNRSSGLSNIVQALITPDGKALDVVVLTGPYRGKAHPVPQHLMLARVPLTRGGHARLLYHGVVGPHGQVSLNSDASGRYLTLTWRLNGWIDHGRLRPLAPSSGAFADAW